MRPLFLHRAGSLSCRAPHDSISLLCVQASAVVGVVAGNVADWLQEARGWTAVRVRALTQSLATLGELYQSIKHAFTQGCRCRELRA